MKRCVALACVATACAGHAKPAPAAPSTARSIFREVSIAPYGAVTLGAPFAQRGTAVAAPVAPKLYALAIDGGRFADTDSILVHVDGAGRVDALRFVYAAGKDYGADVADYATTLGAATRSERDSADAHVERAEWDDGRTRFQLVRVTAVGGAARVMSVLGEHGRAGR